MRIFSSVILAIALAFPGLALAQAVPNYTLRDCGISSLSGSSQSLAVANPNRRFLGIYNTGTASVYVNAVGGTAASTGIASITVTSGSSLIFQGQNGVNRNAVTIIGTTAQPVACFEGN